MSYTGSPLHTEYRKALFKHHQYTTNHFVERLSRLSSDNMTNFPLLNIPGVQALHTTDRTITSGSWRLVTTNDSHIAARIDDYIHKNYTTQPFKLPSARSQKASESVTEATKRVWITQTKISPLHPLHGKILGSKAQKSLDQRLLWTLMIALLARLTPPAPNVTILMKLHTSSELSKNPKWEKRNCVTLSPAHSRLRPLSKKKSYN